jgi:hypothetical protein
LTQYSHYLLRYRYKSAIQARNATCPGFTTFIENIFHSMGALDAETEGMLAPWYEEYLHGAGMEIYFVPLTESFIRIMRYNFFRMSELVYIEWGCTSLGLCGSDKNDAIFNPTSRDMHHLASVRHMFQKYNTLVIIADDQHIAIEVETYLANERYVYDLVQKAVDLERAFSVGSGQERVMQQKLGSDAKNMTSNLSNASAVFGGGDRKKPSSEMAKRGGKLKVHAEVDSDATDDSDSTSDSDCDDDEKELKNNDKGFVPSARTPFSNSGDYLDDSFSEEDSDSENEDGDFDNENYIGFTSKQSIRISIMSGQRAMTKAIPMTNNNVLSKVPEMSPSAIAANTRGEDEEDEEEEEGDGGVDYEDEEYFSSGSDDDDDDYKDEDERDLRLELLRATEQANFGQAAKIVKDVINLSDHIIVHGSDNQLIVFVEELRKPCVNTDIYHPIVMVCDKIPRCWQHLSESFNDLYLIVGKITSWSVLKRLNLKFAYSMSLMAQRTSMTMVDDINVNIGTLFTFLKLERHIPRTLHVTVELTSSANISVLNATIMRRFRDMLEKQMRPLLKKQASGPEAPSAPAALPAHPLLTGSAPSVVGKGNQEIETNLMLFNAQAHSGMATGAARSTIAAIPSPGNAATGLIPAGSNSNTAGGRTAAIIGGTQARGNRRSALANVSGRFATKRSTQINGGNDSHPAKGRQGRITMNALSPELTIDANATPAATANRTVGRRGSALGLVASAISAVAEEVKNAEMITNLIDSFNETSWDAMDSHYVLPVFASAKAFVPSSFESLMVQSFYEKLTPVICDKFVCGQNAQSLRSIKVPSTFNGRKYMDLYRMLCVNRILALALYRAPQQKQGASLPYVVTNPPGSLVLSEKDSVMVFCDSTSVSRFKIVARTIR